MSDTSLKIDDINALFEAYMGQTKRAIKNVPNSTDCLCFTALQDNTSFEFEPNYLYNHIVPVLEYSLDGMTWVSYNVDQNPRQRISLATTGSVCFWRGNNTTLAYHYFRVVTGKAKASGNIMSLLDMQCKCETVPQDGFNGLFSNSSNLVDVAELLLPAKYVKKGGYQRVFYNTGIKNMPQIGWETVEGGDTCSQMFYGCHDLEFVDVPLPKYMLTNDSGYNLSNMFYGCQGLKYVNLDFSKVATDLSSLWHIAERMFYGCRSLEVIRLNIHDFYESRGLFNKWLDGTMPQNAIFVCPADLTISSRDSSHVPDGWTIIKGGQAWDNTTTGDTDVTTTETYMISPGKTVPCVTVSSTLALSALPLVDTGDVAYAEIVLDVADQATVTAGTGITFVDEPVSDQRNICIVRWSEGAAKLYVTMTEDLPSSSSSASA